LAALAVLVGIAAASPPAQAVLLPPSGGAFGKYKFSKSNALLFEGTVAADSNGVYSTNVSAPAHGYVDSMYGEYDPLVGFDFTFTNLGSQTADFEFFWDIDMQPIPGDPWQMRSTLDVVLTDTNGNGVSLMPGPTAAALLEPYLADNRTEYLLLGEMALGASALTAPGAYHYSTEIQSVPPPPVEYATAEHGVMGLRTIFELSPGDTVRFTAQMEIAGSFVIPEPSSLVLACLAAAGGGMLLWRKRRRA
jgi:hypothetical protein